MEIVTKLLLVCIIVLCVLIVDQTAAGLTSCGTLQVRYDCHKTHLDADLHLGPTDHMMTCLEGNSDVHRWWHYFNTSSRQIIPAYNSKHEEINLTLTIHAVDGSDEGTYTMDCIGNGVTCRTNDVKVTIPKHIECDNPTIMPTSSDPGEATKAGVTLTSSVIVVIAVSAVIIAVVIAGTVLIVVRKRKNQTTDTMRLTSIERDSIENLHKEDAGSIYNEIDHSLEHCKGENSGFNSSKLSLLTLQDSPALPKRPLQTKPINESENEYAMIRDSINNERTEKSESKIETNKIKNADEKRAMAVSRDDGYAKIITRQERLKYNDFTQSNYSTSPEYSQVLKHQVKANNENNPEYSKVLKVKADIDNCSEYSQVSKHNVKPDGNGHPEYSKVLKCRKTTVTDYQPQYSNLEKHEVDTDNEKQCGNSKCDKDKLTNFNVVFPTIDCSQIAKRLDDTSNGKNVARTSEDQRTYCNIIPKRRQSKARTSRKEMQYAFLDLSSSTESLDKLGYGPYDLPDFIPVSGSCQYASIDYDKRAFVAPVRKAPSSWYKRRNKKGQGKVN